MQQNWTEGTTVNLLHSGQVAKVLFLKVIPEEKCSPGQSYDYFKYVFW